VAQLPVICETVSLRDLVGATQWAGARRGGATCMMGALGHGVGVPFSPVSGNRSGWLCLVVHVEARVPKESDVLNCVAFKESGRLLACMCSSLVVRLALLLAPSQSHLHVHMHGPAGPSFARGRLRLGECVCTLWD
jgi:hypothetical protein